MRYQVLSPDMPKLESVIPILKKVHHSGTYSNFGPVEKLYREALSERLKISVENLATCANATQGILGISNLISEKTWHVQNFSFAATGLAIQGTHKEIIFLDVDLDTWSVAEDTCRNICGGLVTTIPFGGNVSLPPKFLSSFHIIDAAASLGNLNDLSGLLKNQAVVFSLHATKVLGCGEGGLVAFGDPELAKAFRQWSNFGFSGSRQATIPHATNSKLSEISCAYALANLLEFNSKESKYRQLREEVNILSSDLNLLPSVMKDDIISPYWIVQFKSEEKKKMVENGLKSYGIESRSWWPSPLSLMPALQNCQNWGFAEVNSKFLAETTLGLPFHLALEIDDLVAIGNVLKGLF